MNQFDLFGSRPEPAYPEGFRYQPDVISADEEGTLLEHVPRLPFREFEFHGFTGKRRTVSYGWRYDFGRERLERANEMPDFLLGVRETAARFVGLDPTDLPHVLVNEYAAGAAIGWHRDKGVFDTIVGVSLLSSCVFRLRRQIRHGWERVNIIADRRSMYAMSGPVRRDWEHSIPAVPSLRYSITFRSLRES